MNKKNIDTDNKEKKIDQITNWYLVDAEDIVLGRLSSFLALRLMGKHKPTFSEHLCSKDKIVVINAKKIVLTGKKMYKKKYWHSGYPGGIKSKTYKEILDSKNLTLVLKDAVRRMLKKGSLARKQLKNLYIYANEKHPHIANNPTKLDSNKLMK